ncbi:trypsin-like peptidase domain-containing protein [Paramagnetospirillum marisnigri]|nr:trypsin-like peptidase domain-containing protein [Paramagnetospirillum marisnigri]
MMKLVLPIIAALICAIQFTFLPSGVHAADTVVSQSVIAQALPATVAIYTEKNTHAKSLSKEKVAETRSLPKTTEAWTEEQARALLPKQRDMSASRPDEIPLGSGFIIRPDGFIVTNHHVVAGSSSMTVKLSDGKAYPAEIIGSDPLADLAVIRINVPHQLPTLSFGDSDNLTLGQPILAIGSPFGFAGTVTGGVVSALGRRTEDNAVLDLIQHQAPINVGSSGGALIDYQGRVVGINSAIFSPLGGNIGISFAIAGNQAQPVIEQLLRQGYTVRGGLDVETQPLSQEISTGLPGSPKDGIIVIRSPEQGHNRILDVGDILVSCNGQRIASNNDLARLLYPLTTKAEIPFEMIRDGQRRTVSLLVTPQRSVTVPIAVKEPASDKAVGHATAGMTILPIDQGLSRSLGLPQNQKGMLILAVQPESGAALAGLRPGDIVIAAGTKAVVTADDFHEAVSKARGLRQISLLIQRNGDRNYLKVEIF